MYEAGLGSTHLPSYLASMPFIVLLECTKYENVSYRNRHFSECYMLCTIQYLYLYIVNLGTTGL